MRKGRRTPRRVFFFTFLTVVLVFGTILFANGKRWYDRIQQEKAIRVLEGEIVRLREEEKQKKILLEQLKSPYFIEREAREKFGAKKPGETTVLFPRFDEGSEARVGEKATSAQPHFGDWFRYFFHMPL